MSISKWEARLYDWWLEMTAAWQWIVRIVFCLFVFVAPGAIHHYQSGPFWRKPEPSTVVAVILGCFASITFSILWTRVVEERKTWKELSANLSHANEELANTNKELTEANEKLANSAREMAEMNEDMARWNKEVNEAHDQLKESQQLLKEAYAELERKNNYDPVTGIHGRYYHDDNKPRLEAEARRHGWYLWAVALDVNRLKSVNDTFGHAAGDDLLRFFAEKLRTLVRNTDLCARIGGDEFSIIGVDDTDKVAENLVARILTSMETWYMEKMGLTFKVSASVGYASMKFDEHCTDSVDSIIELADQRMYEHKKIQGIPCNENDQA